MNFVDVMDQRRSMNPIRRKDPRLPMPIFGLVMNFSVSNAFSVSKVVQQERGIVDKICFKEFKRKVVYQLIETFISFNAKKTQPHSKIGRQYGCSR